MEPSASPNATPAGLRAFLGAGVRILNPDGRPASDGDATAFNDAHAALFVLDLEMSGSNPLQHEVLEFGGVRVTLVPGLPEESAWGTKVKPRHIGNAEIGALKVVGYSPRAWKEALDLHAAIGRMAEIGRGAIVTGWGIGNDLAFLGESLRRAGLEWPFATIAVDVQPIARKLLKGTGSVDRFNLGHVADRLGIGRMGEHSALADAYATYDVLLKLLEMPPSDAPGVA